MTKIGFDPWGSKLIVDDLSQNDITEEADLVTGVRQGGEMQGHILGLESQLIDGNLTHCASPLMAWSVGNAKIRVVGNSIMVTKQASGTAKIDALMATFNAAALMLREPDPDISVYTAERGILVFG